MIIHTEISYENRMQRATIFWGWFMGKPKAKRVMVEGRDVTARLGELSRSVIKIAVHDAAEKMMPAAGRNAIKE